MKFIYNSTEYDIGRAQYPAQVISKRSQTRETSASGVVFREDYVVQSKVTTFSFVDMLTVDYVTLIDFYALVGFTLNEFTLVDDLGITSIVHFSSAEINFQKTGFELWAGKISLEVAQ